MQTHKDVTDINLLLKAGPRRAITEPSLSQRVPGVEGEMKYQIRLSPQQRRTGRKSACFSSPLYMEYIKKKVYPWQPQPGARRSKVTAAPLAPAAKETSRFTKELINHSHFQRFRTRNDFSGGVLLLFFTSPARLCCGRPVLFSI